MPIQFREEDKGKILEVHVSGSLVKEDYARFVPEFERLVRLNGKLRLLFDMEDFKGWDAGAAWEDFKFGVDHFSDIERLAIAGDKLWEEGMAIFCRPFTKAVIKYFNIADLAGARKWLAEGEEIHHER
jgi:hypothetical protein